MAKDPRALFVIGSNHHEAPLSVREQFALSNEETLSLQNALRATTGIDEIIVLNTCNRLEFFGVSSVEGIEETIIDQLVKTHPCNRNLFSQHAFTKRNLDAIQHVLEIAAGIDSQMVGETEIVSQLKSAYATASAADSTGPVLNRLIERALQAAKNVRSRFAITSGQVSIGSVAVELAERIFGKLNDSHVLLLGSGEVAEKTAQSLRSRGVASIAVSSRRFDNARALAHNFAGAAIDFEDFPGQLANYDIIIGSTSAPGAILTMDRIQAALQKRPQRPFFLIDLAVPRDMETTLQSLESVFLYDLDDLASIANENLSLRKAEIGKVRKLLNRSAWSIWLQLNRHALRANLLLNSTNHTNRT
jgi:glutamyl-tRNA reductase